jgi:hypothetical protein
MTIKISEATLRNNQLRGGNNNNSKSDKEVKTTRAMGTLTRVMKAAAISANEDKDEA